MLLLYWVVGFDCLLGYGFFLVGMGWYIWVVGVFFWDGFFWWILCVVVWFIEVESWV